MSEPRQEARLTGSRRALTAWSTGPDVFPPMARLPTACSTGSFQWVPGDRIGTMAVRREFTVGSQKPISRTDLLATFQTKRTPIAKVHYTPRNLCMAAGAFVPPFSVSQP